MADTPVALTSPQARKLGQWAKNTHQQSLPWLRGYLFAMAALPIPDITDQLLKPLLSTKAVNAELAALLYQQFTLIQHDIYQERTKLPSGCTLQPVCADSFAPGTPLADWCRGFDDGMGQVFSSWEILLPQLATDVTEELDACWSMLSFFADLHEATEMLANTERSLQETCILVRKDYPQILKAYSSLCNELRLAMAEKSSLASRAKKALPTELQPFDLSTMALEDEADELELLWEQAMQTDDLDARRQLLESALDSAAQALGEETFSQHKGAFWLVHETRPYMQALALLMECLQMQGNLKEAVKKAEYALELAPSDNLGLRYPLIGMLLESHQYSRVHALMEQFDENSVFFHYARALLMFIEQRNSLKATSARKRAVKANPHFARLLSQNADLPEERAPYYSPGDENEAIMLLEFMGNAWYGETDAVRWLNSKG